ncbi:L-lactate MFS transporter [Heyndrickxia ginsengihumi]|uniref:Membrane protein n=1 Tax=Heyndrickxia ginsengihumi TaxID=363870 RepID=A0A0A6VAH4_9BACI|nr:OFA family MFS transporter [Heyndrickxia ginsengihumi]KHD85235.1 membrane protein [Heyndrickxia ginsengihumi]MBE6184183.1 OFA family MFS transporter [Bacillus sp. (in: firmicutes)]MCM3024475.1 OFA family MFS transporter [Heyndrickxia ginsengihumi]
MKGNEHRSLIVLGTIIVQIGLGTVYTWSLFNQPLVDKYGWSLRSVAITFSILSLALSFSTLFATKLQEKWGIRRLIISAGCLLGIGLILSSFISSLWLLYLLAGIFVGFADGTAYITSLSNLIKWFPEKKGLISGVSVGAYGTGSLLFKYVNGAFINHLGVSTAFLCWGIISIILVAGGAFLIKEAANSENKKMVNNHVEHDYSVKEMLKTKQAYLLFVIFFTACMSGLYLIGIVKDIGVSLAGLNVATASNAVALVAIFNTIGRIILGTLSDHVGRMRVISGTLLVTALAVLTLSYVHLNFPLFFICVAAIAFCFGGNITIFPAIVSDYFGLNNQSKNYSVIYQGFGIGAISGSLIAAALGGFMPTFKFIAVLCLISFIITLAIKAPGKEPGLKWKGLRKHIHHARPHTR